jgi:hypothetical protein
MEDQESSTQEETYSKHVCPGREKDTSSIGIGMEYT